MRIEFNFVLKTIYDIGYKIVYDPDKDDDTELIGKITLALLK